MRILAVVASALAALLVGAILTAATVDLGAQTQAAQPVDFVRDVQPIFRQSCYGCHGPSQQMSGFRLDRRADAMRGGTIAVIGPGNSEGSRMYLRLIGNAFGPQMPPTGALPSDQVAVIKKWIDEGAHWPDEAAGDVAAPPVDPAAADLVDLLRRGDFAAVRSRIAGTPALANARGPGGATPFMFAVLYADLATVRELIDRGADVNARNDAGATALMWAVSDLDKTRVLLERGADVHVRSQNGRTALMIAAGEARSAPVVKLLIDKGADVNSGGPALVGQTTALTEAAMSGNEEAFRLLAGAGADLVKAGPLALALALRAGCTSCADALTKAFPPQLLTVTMVISGPPLGPALGTPMFLERGATLDARDESGRSMLMLSAASEAMPVDAVKQLLARKVDVNERTAKGETALGLARRHGNSPMVATLLEAGAKDEPMAPAPSPSPARSTREALGRALPLLQKTDVTFLKKSGCVSCHNNSLTAMTVADVRKQGLAVDASIAREQSLKAGAYLESWRERALQGLGIPGDADTVSYILLGLAAEGYPADLQTDAQAYFLKRQQAADGRWRILAHRPPIESSDIQVTAASMRALQLYAPPAQRSQYDQAVQSAAAWLRTAPARVTEERAFQLLGLHWSKAPSANLQQAGRALIAEQRADGGWAQLPTMTSDAYATGQSLYALAESGVLDVADPVYRRGVEFLLRTQLADGSWFVRTRALPIQPLFNADFPHGADAFISAAATNWAALALARDAGR
jgi:ankyrin repeat protein